jgi:Fe2+ or Zn2+ uptake regulation protein
MQTKQDAIDRLRDEGHQVTPQREYLIELCLDSDGHFTADDLFERDENRKGDLSQATIYNTLHLLVDVGFLRELNDMGSSCYYEIKDQVHPHARCSDCGQLMDIPVDLKEQVRNWNLPFEVEGIRMTVDGRCQDCAEAVA